MKMKNDNIKTNTCTKNLIRIFNNLTFCYKIRYTLAPSKYDETKIQLLLLWV